MGMTSQIIEEGISEGERGLKYLPFPKDTPNEAYNEPYFDGFYYGRMVKKAKELGVDPMVVRALCQEPRWKPLPSYDDNEVEDGFYGPLKIVTDPSVPKGKFRLVHESKVLGEFSIGGLDL